MEALPEKKEHKLPTLEELYNDKEELIKQTKLQIILNSNPNPKWIKQNNGLNYMPIGIVEFLLTSIFKKWWVEVKNIQLIANSIVTTVRLFVIDPINGETLFQDGIGASPVQTEKGAGATEFNKIGTFAVQKAAPASESYAIKDAAEKFGKIFGSDISRNSENTLNPQSTLEKQLRTFNIVEE